MLSLPPERHAIHQVSVMSALLDGVYDGDQTIGQLLHHGDFGLGTFDALDGELLVLDGVAYRLRSDGDATVAAADDRTPFAVITTFVAHAQCEVPTRATQADIVELLADVVPSQNYLYAIRIRGRFVLVRTRTVARQSQPYRPLVAVTAGEPVVEQRNVFGTLAGFRTPLYERGIGVPGGHVHFIDESLRRGGHVLDFILEHGTIDVCIGTDLHLALPMTEAFAGAHLDPADLDFQVERTERHD
ncbi:MAG: acetolactate decarboxylase [Ilumatobacteraceae bacterium]